MTAETMTSEARALPRAAPGRARLPTWMPVTAVAVILAARIVFSLVVPPNEDEAYYFQWGQHLQLSYFDHAPLHGWMQGLAAAVFGFSNLALRAMNQVTLLGSAVIFWAWAGRLDPENRVNAFWTILAVYLSSPLIFGITTLAYPDHWLMFLCLASLHFFAMFLGECIEGRPGRYRDLYLGAAILGLAGLAKYNAVTMGVALALFIIVHPRLRKLLGDPHLYFAALVSFALLTPMLVWNAGNGFVSFRFQLWERYLPGGPGLMGEFSFERFLIFAILTVLYISPVLMLSLASFYWRPAGPGFRGAAVGFGKWMFAVSTLTISAISFFARGAPHWNIVALIGFVPFAFLFFRWRLVLAAHLVVGIGVALVLSGYFSTFPLSRSELLGDREAASYYGYDQVAARMEELRNEHGAAAIAAISYGATSKLAFGAGPGVAITSLSPVHDSFDEWRDEAALAGRDLIIFDEFQAIGVVANQFEEIVKLEDFEVTRFGQPIIRYEFYLGRGYKGQPAP